MLFTYLFGYCWHFGVASATTVSPGLAADSAYCEDYHLNLIDQFHLDAVILANYTLTKTLSDGTDFKNSTAYANYFEPEDYTTVHTMYTAIDDFLWKRPNNLWFLCPTSDSQPLGCKDTGEEMGGIAFVDPDPAATDMTIPMTASGFGFCYSFFDYVQSYSNTHWYNKTDEEWCRAMTFEDYVASGYYSLQLFTQTHLFGSLAGLPLHRVDHSQPGLHPREFSAGAIPLLGPKPWVTARLIREQWAKVREGGPEPTIQRIQSATSYAAAALEWYALVTCARFAVPA